MFIDQAKIFVKAGNGGDGVCSFRREKFVPFGGPDGGDGGHGGHVIITASKRATTLLDFRYQRRYEAPSGRPGQGSQCHGRTGSNIVITVPVGTVIRDEATGQVMEDLTRDEQSFIIAHGGRGGRGNLRFKSSTNRAPRQFEHGSLGEALCLNLELKLLADVGLVGLPNAGKSTLISSISAARPEIAEYPFTTLRPHLGVVALDDLHSLVMADIPGLIEGAHKGKGLGIQFLRHIQRAAFLLYLIDISEWGSPDPVASITTLQQELAAFDSLLEQRSFAVVGTKLDIKGNGENLARLQAYCQQQGFPFFPISAVSREGIGSLIVYIGKQKGTQETLCETSS
ncbi:MAG: GTPase ObgE [Nitrospinae bacterium]|nr:GTPase ObgE [Nitrospinota bacterium]